MLDQLAVEVFAKSQTLFKTDAEDVREEHHPQRDGAPSSSL